MSLHSTFISFGLILSYFILPKSDNKIQEIISKTDLFNLRFPQERIYLHLDRPSYWAGDDIWYKAYAKDSPIDNCNLYVELINSSGSVVYKNISWLQNGLAYGDIHLRDTISTGIYQIRAYTNWMRNFDEQWFFRKDLVIWNLLDRKFKERPVALKSKNIDLRFFPEGGTYIYGTENKIAFKATDQNGKGIDVKGILYDDSGKKIIDIKSSYKGMGSFLLEPERSRKYWVELDLPGIRHIRYDLPEPTAEGVILTIDPTNSQKIQVRITEKSSDTENDRDQDFLLIGQNDGKICYHEIIPMKEGSRSISIEKNALPGGIVEFTLFDPTLIPLCERLVFNNHLKIIPLVVKTEKSTYKQREGVKLGIAAMLDASQPCESNLSVSVYNSDTQIQTDENSDNIFTHFLLNSELRGSIENPAYYFKDDSLVTLLALDNLMLTHGYRAFEWKEILEDDYPEIRFPPEPSLEIRGKVISESTGEPVAGGKVTMMTLKSLLKVQETETDSLGQFIFSNLFFNDTLYYTLQAVNKRGTKNTSIEIDHSSGISPEVSYLPASYEYSRGEPVQTLTYLSDTKSGLLTKKWSLSDTILLEDVYVATRRREIRDEHPRIYLKPDYVYDMNKQDDVYNNVFESIEGRIPGVIFDAHEQAFYARGQQVRIYMDGMEDRNGIVGTLPSQMFDQVEYIRSGLSVGINYSGGILFFYSKRGGQMISTLQKSPGMSGSRIVGYSVIRKFYSPTYESSDRSGNKEDHRNTIYWNPVVKTDSSGFAFVGFYNSDDTGDIHVVVEGVTSDGLLCRGTTRYTVSF